MGHTISNKNVREQIAYAESLGFQWDGKISGGGHVKMTHPGGGRIVLGITNKRASMVSRTMIKREARRSGVSVD